MGNAEKKGLSGAALKYIAAACMLVDHIAWLWFPSVTAAGFIMHFFGRFTAPIMCFMAAEGYRHTKSVKKYLLRLALFAAVSHLPVTWFETLNFSAYWAGMTSMIATLFLGVASLAVCDDKTVHPAVKAAFTALCIYLSLYCDWSIVGVLWVLVFGMLPERRTLATAINCVFAALLGAFFLFDAGGRPYILFQFATVPALILTPLLYNGEKGSYPKYFFYVLYPAHLLVLAYLGMKSRFLI